MIENKYYVYHVLHEGEIVYVGKGKGNRYLHATSGASHSKGLNELWMKHTLLGESKPIVSIVEYFTREEDSLHREAEDICNYSPILNIVKGATKHVTPKQEVDIYNDDFSYGHLHDYKKFTNRHPAWVNKDIFQLIIHYLKTSSTTAEALLTVNNILEKMGITSYLTEEYLWEVACYLEWVDELGYMFTEEGLPKDKYLSCFLDKRGLIPKEGITPFLDNKGNIHRKYLHLVSK